MLVGTFLGILFVPLFYVGVQRLFARRPAVTVSQRLPGDRSDD